MPPVARAPSPTYAQTCKALQRLTDKDLARVLQYGNALLEAREDGTAYAYFRSAAQEQSLNWGPWKNQPARVRQSILKRWQELQAARATLNLSPFGEYRCLMVYLILLKTMTPVAITPQVFGDSQRSILDGVRECLPYPDQMLGPILNGTGVLVTGETQS